MAVPAAPARPRAPWPLYPLDPRTTYVNVGFWSTVAVPPGDRADGRLNRLIEQVVRELGGHKSLYSDGATTTETSSGRLYGARRLPRPEEALRPRGRLLDLYDKTVRPTMTDDAREHGDRDREGRR